MKQAHIQLVCDMNNTGVDFLVVGLFHSARVVFAEAIEAAKLILIEDDNDNTNENCARATGTETSHFADSLFQSCTINTPYFADEKYGASLAVDITNSPSSEDGIFVYHRAFKLRYHHYDVPRLQSVCTVILYNMGIVFHLPHIASCSPKWLKQAVTYYGLAISACSQTTTPDGIPPVLRLIILNNLGEIYFRLCQYDDMASVYNHLKSSWCDAENIIALVGEPFLNGVEKHGFLWNLLVFKRPDLAAAA